MRNLRYEFSKETKAIFNRRYCMSCGRTDYPLERHHIFGRVSASPLNCILVCAYNNDSCHESIGDVHNDKNEALFAEITFKYLVQKNFEFDEASQHFIEKYYRIYEPIIQRLITENKDS